MGFTGEPVSGYETARFRLRGLDPQARYAFRNVDDGTVETMTGGELMGSGLRVHVPERPSAAVLLYKKVAE